MAINLPIGGGAKTFGDMGPASSDSAAAEAVPSNGQSTLKASDKEKIEEVIAMMPQTWLNPLLAVQIWNQIGQTLSLKQQNMTPEQKVGSIEQSIVLAMMLTFAQTNSKIGAQATEDRKVQEAAAQDPIKTALEEYIKKGKGTPLNGEMLQMIQQSPLLLNSLQSLDPRMVAKAYETALQTIVPHMYGELVVDRQATLDRFSGVSALSKQTEASRGVAKTYLDDVQIGGTNLTHPMLSIAFAGVIGGSSVQVPVLIDPKTRATIIDPTKDSVMPAGQGVITDMVSELGTNLAPEVQATLALSLSQLVSNVQVSSAYWSIPGALTLKAATTAASAEGAPKPPPSEAEVRSYAMTISQFVLGAQFDKLARSIILKNCPPGAIPEERLQTYVATMKVMLLTNALGAMDKVMTESVVIRAADIESLLAGTVQPPLDASDFRLTLVKLVNEQFSKIGDTDQARLKDSLRVYFDKNPDLTSLIDPAKAFLAITDSSYFNKANMEQRT